MKKVLALVLALLMVTTSMVFVVTADAAEGLVTEDVYSFVVFEESEKAFKVRSSAGANDAQRFSDLTGETVYKYTITNTDDVQYVKWYTRTWGHLLLQVTTEDASASSDVNWTEIYNAGDEVIDTLDRVYDFTDALVSGGKMASEFYVRVANSAPSGGNGGSIFTGVNTELVVGRTPTAEEAANGDADELAGKAVEKKIFVVNEDSEKDYLIRDTAGWNGSQRFSDGAAEVVYKYEIKNTKTVEKILWTAKTSGQLLLQVTAADAADSSSGVEWKEVAASAACLDADIRTYDLTSLLVTDGVAPKTFYVRVADTSTDDGSGGSIWTGNETVLKVVSTYNVRDYAFRVGEKSENKFLMEYAEGSALLDWCRYNDEYDETVYQFTVRQSYGVEKILWNIKAGGQLDIKLTKDNASKSSTGTEQSPVEWTTVYSTTDTLEDGELTVDLTQYLVNADGTLNTATFYLRVGDAEVPGGNGGRLDTGYDQTLTVLGEKVQPVVIEVEREESTFEDAQLKYTATVKEGGNYCFTTISHPDYTIGAGDYIMYDVKMDAASIAAGMGFIDMNFVSGKNLRDNGMTDSYGVQVHPNGTLTYAKDNMWITRTIDLTPMAGESIKDFQLSTHPAGRAAAGTYTAYYDNIKIYNAVGAVKCIIYVDETYVNAADVADVPSNGISGTVENVECTAYEHEYYVFTPLDDTDPGTEKEFLYETNAGNNGSCRFSDTTLHTIYKFTIENTLSVERINFTATMGAQMVFSASMDGKEWVEIYRSGLNNEGGQASWKVEEHTLNLANAWTNNSLNTLYIKIEDATTNDGYGGQITKSTDAMLDVWYVKLSDEELNAYEAKRSEHCVPLFGCNVEFGGWKLDKENKVAGSASLTKSVGQGSADAYKFDAAVDATGMDTFEFDIWVSDTAFFTAPFADTGFELTSAGKSDNQEISWNLASILENNKGDVLIANSWCHVILPISTAKANNDGGEFNVSAVNFTRFFFVGAAADTGITLKIDNLTLTDYAAQKDKEAEAEAAPAIEKMNALKDAKFSDDNAKSLKSEVTKARKAYDKLSDEAKAKVPAEVLKYLTDAEKARDEYDASKEVTPTPTDEPTATPTEEPTGEPTAHPTEAPDDNNNSTLVIVIVAVVVVLAAAACLYFFVFKKKK